MTSRIFFFRSKIEIRSIFFNKKLKKKIGKKLTERHLDGIADLPLKFTPLYGHIHRATTHFYFIHEKYSRENVLN